MQYLRQLFDILLFPLKALLHPSKLKQLMHLSLPAGIALLVAVFLIVSVVAVLVALAWHTGGKLNEFQKLSTLWLILLLVILIPIFTYFGVRLWLEGDPSAFDDIDRAWAAGLAELQRHGLDLQQLPLFLVLGSEGDERERALFAASRLRLSISNFPAGPGPLHWYVNADGAYLVCTGVGCLSRLVALSHGASPVAPVRGHAAALPPGPGDQNIAMTMMISEPSSAAEAGPQATAALAAPPLPTTSADDVRGTMFVGSVDARTMVAGAKAGAARSLGSMNRDEFEHQSRRLEHLCRLINQARRPLTPINGVLALLPLDMILADRSEGVTIKESVRTDTTVLVKRLKVLAPVTLLVVGLEEEPGFRELIARIPRERCELQRLGKGFGVWDPPTSEELGACCQIACGAFEDWVYNCFREADSLAKPGNRALYSLLCKIRRDVEGRLDKVLVKGFNNDDSEQGQNETLLFSGCYFAAAGDTKDRQAFVKGVFDKLLEEEAELEWTEAALRENRWYERIAYVALTVDVLLLAGLGALIYYR